MVQSVHMLDSDRAFPVVCPWRALCFAYKAQTKISTLAAGIGSSSGTRPSDLIDWKTLQVVRATSKTQTGEIRMLNNTATVPGGVEEALPESFFHKKSACHENTEFSGQWEPRDFEGCFSNRFHESRCPGSTATFKW